MGRPNMRFVSVKTVEQQDIQAVHHVRFELSNQRKAKATSTSRGLVGYNVQTAVDTKHHLIVAHEVTNTGSDLRQFSKMAK